MESRSDHLKRYAAVYLPILLLESDSRQECLQICVLLTQPRSPAFHLLHVDRPQP